MPHAADRIRNVALVGHRGSGKTSLHEALLFEAGATNRLGTVADGTTVSDSEEDEQARGMSISAALASFEWKGVKVNLIDTPGEPSFIADALGALRVCESAVFVVNAVMGVEVSTQRLWSRAAELGVARLIYVNMLDRERADFFRTLDSLKTAFGPHVVATEIPIGSEHEVRGLIDLVDMKAYEYSGSGRENCKECPIPDDMADLAQEYREKLMDEVAENSDALMERYLEGEEISHEEIVHALEEGTDSGHIYPVTCGVATQHLGADRLLDAIVDDLPSPVQHGGLELEDMTLEADPDGETFAYVFKTRADPFAGRINLFRVYQGTVSADSHLLNTRAHAKERMGQLLVPQGKEVSHTDAFGPGDIGAVAKLKETRAGDWLADRDQPISMPSIALPAPVMAFAIEPKAKGDEDKVFTALRRLQEEDPTIDLHRDDETGEQIVAGLSQIHVEVVVDRLKSRFGAEVTLKPPRVPYQETIRGSAKAHGRHKKQSGGRGQFGDCHIEIEPLAEGEFEFVNNIKGGVIPTSFIPAVEKGVVEAMRQGVDRRLPAQGHPRAAVRRQLPHGRLVGDGVQDRGLDRHEGGGLETPARCCSSRSCSSPPRCPSSAVGDVMGDLSSRRGRPLGTENAGGMTEVKAEVPMAELLTYAPDLRSITGGQGEYTLEFVRYEEVPSHLAQKIVQKHDGGGRSGQGLGRPLLRSPRRGEHARHPHEPGRHLLRRLRPDAPARRARGVVSGRWRAPPGVRAVHRARAARGLDPRGRRRRADAARPRARSAGAASWRSCASRRERAREVAEEAAAEEEAAALEPAARRSRARRPTCRAARATSAPCRPTPSSRSSARSRSSTRPSTPARSAGSPARWALRRSARVRSPTARAWSRSP